MYSFTFSCTAITCWLPWVSDEFLSSRGEGFSKKYANPAFGRNFLLFNQADFKHGVNRESFLNQPKICKKNFRVKDDLTSFL